jgi:hypothetical protein
VKKNMTTLIGAGAGALIILLVAGLMISRQYSKARELQGKIDELQAQIDMHRAVAERGPDLERKKDQIARTFDKFVTIFPKKENADRVFDTLQLYGAQTKIDIKRVGIVEEAPTEPGRPGAARPAGPKGPQYKNFGTRENTIEVEGTFFDFVEFLNKLESHREFLQVDSFTMAPKRDAGRGGDAGAEIKLTITMKLRTFFYDPKA